MLKKKHNKIWTISAFLEFYRPRTPDYSWLRPKQAILEEIKHNLISIGNAPIGLHVRRTDNKMAIKRSPLYLFIDKVEKILSENSQQRFFLATDDNGVKDEMMSRFPEHIFSRYKLAKREDPNGLKDAVIDLFLLASCKSLYGSSWSSFSDVAADIGRIPFERLEIEE